MTSHLIEKFSDRIDQIKALLQTDASFGEVCADYEEICTWLIGHCQTASGPSDECGQARDLKKELENEIYRVLNEAKFQFSHSIRRVIKGTNPESA